MNINLLSIYTVLISFIIATSCSTNDEVINEEKKQTEVIFKGTVKASNIGISGVVVTDGYNLVKTDAQGNFSLSSTSKAQYLYISSPSGYTVPVEKSVPQFYKKITSSTKEEETHFELFKMNESDDVHYFVAIGDPQVRNNNEVAKLKPILEYLKKDIAKNQISPLHMMVTGDVVFDTPNMHEASKSTFSLLDQPVYYTIGNHDHLKNTDNQESALYDKVADKDFKEHYGPTYYSFNRGSVHYIIFDNILFYGGPDTKYSSGTITQEQLDWIRKDLEYVSKDKVIVLMAHAPTKSRYVSSYGNSDKLYELLKGYSNVHIITGHTHYNSVMADNTNITDHIIGAICGGWWEGPTCPDGTYLGYKIFKIDGTNVTWRYRAYEFPEEQFSVYTPKKWYNTDLPFDNKLVVNVWDWDVNWSVMWSQDGKPYQKLDRVTSRLYDPKAYEYFGASNNSSFPQGRGWIAASPTDHIFTAIPDETTEKISIKVVNPFGEEFIKDVSLTE